MANAAIAPRPGRRKAAPIRRRKPLPGLWAGVHPLDFVAVAVRQRRLILVCALVFGLLTAVAVYGVMSVKYQSEAIILPPDHPSEPLTGGTLVQLEYELASTQGVKKKDPQDFWGTVLTSRTVMDYMINRFDLWDEYKTKDRDAAERKLMRRTTFEEPTSGLIYIRVKDPSPVKAAQMANGYIDALQERMNALAVSDAQQREVFFQGQVNREKEQLELAEAALTAMQQKTGLVTLRGQTGEVLEQIADLKGRIRAKELQIEAQKLSETPEDPDMTRLQAQLDGLRAELTKLEQQNPAVEAMGDVGPNALPGGQTEYMRAVRDLRYHESLYQALAKHAAGARMDEVRTAPPIDVLQTAIPSEAPAGLQRWLYVVLGVLAGAFLGWIAGMVRESYRKMKLSPSGQYRLQLIRRELHKRRANVPQQQTSH
jgi:uncharacterized protein involved in exopolysaccharide biosynthesis